MENINTNNHDTQASFIIFAYKNLPAMMLVNVSASLGAAFIFSGYSQPLSLAFITIMLALSVVRLYRWQQFQKIKVNKDFTSKEITLWAGEYNFFLCLSGALWATLGFAAIHLASKEIEYPIIIIMSALSGGATAVTAPLKRMGKIYISLLLTPLFIGFLLQGTLNYYILAMLALIFLIVMLITQERNYQILRDSFILRSDNISLISDLREINNNLEKTVDHRTLELKNIANKDDLTGIANRRGLMEWMNANLTKASATNNSAVLFLDLDRFKEINDAKGHEVGDEVLKMASLRFKSCCGDAYMLARWGGDEFVIITPPNAAAQQIVATLAEQLFKITSPPFIVNDEALSLGLSIGSAYYPSDAPSFKEVIHAADLAAAEVKRTGRGKLLAFNDRYADIQKTRYELSRALGIAIANHALTVSYQPIVNAKTGEIESFEALARWTYDGKTINPETFIDLAEKTDRIIDLGYYILRVACKEAASWLQIGHQQKIAVNVSVKQLLSEQFCQHLLDILKQTTLPPEQLTIEVTESIFDDNHKNKIYDTVQQIRNLGIMLQIDDFGTGYSSLSRLHQFPISTIKIDRTFVSQIHHQGHAIIKSTILIARSFNQQVIAEGVETVEQASELYSMGIDFFQGYYFSKPSQELRFTPYQMNWHKNHDKA